MSILIKGVEMPKDETCVIIRVRYNENGKPRVFIVLDREERLLGEIQPVPTPHGRLLNLRDIAELACRTKDRMTLRQLSDLPTVIEAEE